MLCNFVCYFFLSPVVFVFLFLFLQINFFSNASRVSNSLDSGQVRGKAAYGFLVDWIGTRSYM